MSTAPRNSAKHSTCSNMVVSGMLQNADNDNECSGFVDDENDPQIANDDSLAFIDAPPLAKATADGEIVSTNQNRTKYVAAVKPVWPHDRRKESLAQNSSPAELEAVAQRKFSFVRPSEKQKEAAQEEVERKFSRYTTKSGSSAGNERLNIVLAEVDVDSVQEENQKSSSRFEVVRQWLQEYLEKVFDRPTVFPPTLRPPWYEVLAPGIYSAIIAFLSIFSLWIIHAKIMVPFNLENNSDFRLASYSQGSVAVVVFEAYQGPFAQPWNTIVGSSLSCFIGLTVRLFLYEYPFIAAPMAVALAIIVMRISHSTHPPSGAIAVAAALSPDIPVGAWAFVHLIAPTLVGSMWLVLCAMLLNNLCSARQYPQYWL